MTNLQEFSENRKFGQRTENFSIDRIESWVYFWSLDQGLGTPDLGSEKMWYLGHDKCPLIICACYSDT